MSDMAKMCQWCRIPMTAVHGKVPNTTYKDPKIRGWLCDTCDTPPKK